jgi:hypothetical protein
MRSVLSSICRSRGNETLTSPFRVDSCVSRLTGLPQSLVHFHLWGRNYGEGESTPIAILRNEPKLSNLIIYTTIYRTGACEEMLKFTPLKTNPKSARKYVSLDVTLREVTRNYAKLRLTGSNPVQPQPQDYFSNPTQSDSIRPNPTTHFFSVARPQSAVTMITP